MPAVAGFPLPDNYFPALDLSEVQIARYEWQMREIVQSALVEYNLHEVSEPLASHGSAWTVAAAADGLTTIRPTAAGTKANELRIFGRTNGDYRNFIDFFYSETSKQLFEWNQIMFGNTVDAAVLANIHTAASHRPHTYMGVKWVCLQPSSFSRKRDHCFLEYMIYTKDLKGRDVGVRVTLPLDIPECPPLPGQLKTARIKMHIVSIARPADDNSSATQLFMMCENDLAGFRVPKVFLKKIMSTLASMTLLADSKRLSMVSFASPREWVKKSSRRSCRICSRAFHATRRRRHCRLCGDVFCPTCVVEREAPVVDSAHRLRTDFQAVKTRFCKMCVANMRMSDMAGLASSEALTASSSEKGEISNRSLGGSSSVTNIEDSGADDSEFDGSEFDGSEFEGSEVDESEDGKDEHFSIGLDDESAAGHLAAKTLRLALSPESTLDSIEDDAEAESEFHPRGSLDVVEKRASEAGKPEPLIELYVPEPASEKQISRQSSSEVAEELDTKEMLMMSRRFKASSPVGGLSRSVIRPVDQVPSTQSITDRIAEQEELLRQMILTASRAKNASM